MFKKKMIYKFNNLQFLDIKFFLVMYITYLSNNNNNSIEIFHFIILNNIEFKFIKLLLKIKSI